MKIEVKAQVGNNGKLEKIFGNAKFFREMEQFSGKNVKITVEIWRKVRSERQNKFYWGNYVESQIECFKEYWGGVYTKEQIHTWNKANIFCTEELIGDEIIKIPVSSTVHTTVSWEEKLEVGREFFRSRFQWELPYPLEQSVLQFQED